MRRVDFQKRLAALAEPVTTPQTQPPEHLSPFCDGTVDQPPADHSGLYQTDESWNDPPDADIGEMVEQFRAAVDENAGGTVTVSADALSALLTDRDDLVRKLGVLEAKYEELIYAVSIKHPQEDRHETALRYITQAETNCGQGGAALKALEG